MDNFANTFSLCLTPKVSRQMILLGGSTWILGTLSLAQRVAESWLGVAVVSANSTPFFSKQMLQSLKLSQSLSSSPQWHFSCLELWGGEHSLFSLSIEHGPSCVAPFMNMHEIRYDIALLPLIILSSDLSSRKLQSMACRTNVAWRQTRGKGHLFRHLFYLIGIEDSNIWAFFWG